MVEADLSPLYNNLRKYNGAGVHKYWQVDFDICVEFGGTQLVARLQWKQGVRIPLQFSSLSIPNAVILFLTLYFPILE